MKKKQKIVVLGIIENNKDEILVAQRHDPKIKDAHLKWDVPGGTNELGESLKETLQREVIEETGLNIEILDLFPHCVSKNWEHEDYFQHTLVFCYLCKLIDGKLHMNDSKIKDLKWIKASKALNLELLPTTRVFIRMFSEKI